MQDNNEVTEAVKFELKNVALTGELAETEKATFEVIEEIKKLNLISPEERKSLVDAQAFALSSFRDVPTYRPMIVKLTSVLNDANFPTIDKKFWQCKIEAEVHFNELVKDYYKFERSLVDINELDYKIGEIDKILNREVEPNEKLDPNLVAFDRQRLIIKRSQYEYEMKLLEKDIKYRIKEVTDWSYISKQLESKCEYSTTSFEDHTVKGHILFLKSKIKNPNLPEQEKKMYQAQLDTFERLNKAP